MADVADVTAGITNKTEKADLAYKLFGARGAGMINVLEGGSKAMREAMLEADKLGLVMSAETAKGVEDANDAMTRLAGFLTSTFHQAVAKIAPLIETITNNIRAWVETKVTEEGGIGKLATKIATQIVLAGIAILQMIEDVTNGFIEMGRTIQNLPFVGSRPIQDIKDDIYDLEMQIGMLKASLAGGTGLLDILGIGDQSSLDTANKQLEELQKELGKTQKSFKAMEFVSFQKGRNILQGVIDDMSKVQKKTKKIITEDEAAETIWDKVGKGFDKYKEHVNKGNITIASATLKGMQSIEDGIVNMVMGVKTSFKDMARSIIADLIRMQVRALLVRSISGGFGFKLPGFAAGGRPTPNQPSIVGERGAELFIPDRAGTIVPNHQLNTATGEVRQVSAEINFNVQAIDAASFNNYLVNNRGTIESIINSSLTSNGSVRRTIKQVV
jgi:hypothetical protein